MNYNKQIINVLAIVVALFFVSCAARQQPVAEETATLRIMTYNVHHCNPPGMEGVIDVDIIAAVIAAQGADLVALQEVDIRTGRSGGIDQVALLAEKGGYPSYYYGKAMDYDGGAYGILLLSKYPLSETVTYPLPMSESAIDEPRVLAAATIELPGEKKLRFATVHLEAYNNDSRLMQAREICRIAGETHIPMIVAGDLNAYEEDEVIRIFDEVFIRSCYDCPITYDEEDGAGAIDYILFHPGEAFHIIKHEVIQNREASDHRPVVVDIEWNTIETK